MVVGECLMIQGWGGVWVEGGWMRCSATSQGVMAMSAKAD